MYKTCSYKGVCFLALFPVSHSNIERQKNIFKNKIKTRRIHSLISRNDSPLHTLRYLIKEPYKYWRRRKAATLLYLPTMMMVPYHGISIEENIQRLRYFSQHHSRLTFSSNDRTLRAVLVELSLILGQDLLGTYQVSVAGFSSRNGCANTLMCVHDTAVWAKTFLPEPQ